MLNLSSDDRDQELALHLRLLAGDVLAPPELCRAHLEALLRWARRRFPADDPDLRDQAVHDALLLVVKRPAKYDPQKGSLRRFLRGVAARVLRKLRQRERHACLRRIPDGFVEQPRPDGQQKEEDDRPARLQRAVAAVALDAQEQVVLALMQAGERRTEVFAAALKLVGPRDWVTKQVRCIKNRVLKRLQRDGGLHEQSA